MAEVFLFNIIDKVTSHVSSLAVQEISLAWNIKAELKKLENTLSTVKAVLMDAGTQQATNHEVKDWLEKLQDVVYDVDDLLDSISTQVLCRQAGVNSSILKQVTKFFSSSNQLLFRFKMGHKAVEIRERLDEIAADRKNFHFAENIVVVPAENKLREETHSFVRASDIIGRDTDKSAIIDLLMKSCDREDVSVIPIVGLGGLGKTTLIKLVYNDIQVVENFDLRMWVCLSEDLSLSKVIEKILKSATGESFGHLDVDQIQGHLRHILSAKRFLLVLDDVWNEDRNSWTELRDLLINGCAGSKIIVTTRSKMITTITGTIPPYNLSSLSDDDCLSLFSKCAFRVEKDWLPNLLEIGKEIVKKCGGVPLAVKTLGSLLYMNTDEREWLRIRDNDIWEIEQKESDILPILRLSYEQMPVYLRQCFAYCSMCPKGQEIPREEFINLWIALGIIRSPNNTYQELEDVGNRYFSEILSRFCFQDVTKAFDGEILACKIHSLVHDLAQSVAGTECLNMKAGAKAISERVRHVQFPAVEYPGGESSGLLLKLKKMRSISYLYGGSVGKIFVKKISTRLHCLRVLQLSSVKLKELPKSISKLKHLRYLNLRDNRSIKSLPNSISKLVNLQTLNLINCEQFQELPKNIRKLVSLKTLYLTSQQIHYPKRNHPSLSSLRILLLYKSDCQALLSQGLHYLTGLRVLRIYECPRLTYLPRSIKYLTSLEKLWIWDCEELNLFDGEGMEGLKRLRSLLLMGLPKLEFLPEGLKEAAASSLQYLRIANCSSLTKLPTWLQSFTSLIRLYIEDCPSLVAIPEGVEQLTAEMHISGCPSLSD